MLRSLRTVSGRIVGKIDKLAKIDKCFCYVVFVVVVTMTNEQIEERSRDDKTDKTNEKKSIGKRELRTRSIASIPTGCVFIYVIHSNSRIFL